MDKLINLLKADLERVGAYTPRMLAALLVLYISYLAGKYLSRLVLNLLRRTSMHEIHATFNSWLTGSNRGYPNLAGD